MTEAEWAAIEAEDAKYVPPSDEFVKLVLATYPNKSWLKWNANTGYFSINPRMFDAQINVGFDDISVEEMMRIYNRTTAATTVRAPYNSAGIRINLPPYNYSNPGFSGVWALYNSKVQVLMLASETYLASCGNVTEITNCSNLRVVFGGLVPGTSQTAKFTNCPKLEHVHLYPSNKSKILIPDSPLLSYYSLESTFSRASTFTEPNAPTLQVHPDVYAKLTGDYTNEAAAALTAEERAQWLALGEQATAKNIIFTTQT